MSNAHPVRLGRYPIRGVIGAGSMGVVYLGHDPEIDRPVAIKTVHKHLLVAAGTDSIVAARFRLEAKAAGRLSHPGIVTVYDVGEDADCAYIAMEYVAGRSLRQYLLRGWRFTLAETLSLVSQLLEALGAAHAKGVLHRDIKPGNLYIDAAGRLKLGDFGIARVEASQLTRTESVLGSPGYMAPEQYTGGETDRRVDLFSVGVILYQLLSARMPFSGTEQAVMYQVVYGEPDALCKDSADAALAPYDALVRQALARHPAQRFESAEAFRQALEAAAPTGWRQQPLAADRIIHAALPETARPADAPSHPAAPATPVPLPPGWNEATLAGIERELTYILGPIARLLIRRTALETSTLDALRQRVAAHIPDRALRERFLAAGGPAAGSGGALPGFRHTEPFGLGTGARLTPVDVERAASVMVHSLGPIAKVLARRCASDATTREHFVELVLNQVAQGAERERLKAKLWKCWA